MAASWLLRDWRLLVGGSILVLFVAIGIAAPVLAPYDPKLPTGAPLELPGPEHPLGTNDIGQDLFSELIWGARSSLMVAALVSAISTGMAWLVGICAGYFRRLSAPIMALTDLLLALPDLPLYLLIVALAGPGQLSIVLTLGLLSWTGFARVIRAQVLALRGEPYVLAAYSLGATPLRIAVRHVLPGTFQFLPAKLVLTVRFAIFAESTLAFLGLGDPSGKSWGSMLGWAFSYPSLFSRDGWLWWVLPPALAITAVVVATSWVATAIEQRPPSVRPQQQIPKEGGVLDARPVNA